MSETRTEPGAPEPAPETRPETEPDETPAAAAETPPPAAFASMVTLFLGLTRQAGDGPPAADLDNAFSEVMNTTPPDGGTDGQGEA